MKINKNKLYYIAPSEIERLRKSSLDRLTVCNLLASALRINILYMIKNAGSGHIGTSFSSVDIMLWLWVYEMHRANDPECPDPDTFFSSKGHDAPAIYSVLTALGKLPFESIHKLRKLGGLPGHPDIHTPYMATNTGPLGMGISKARGMAIANRLNGKKGKMFIITGDGELQEGQIWESLQPTANGKFSEITVIVDMNKIQSDTAVSQVSNLGEIEEKFRSFGWEVACCDGNDFQELEYVFDHFRKVEDKPKILLAQTVKGRGVSFMEALDKDGLYKFHSGAPSDENYHLALEELVSAVNAKLSKIGKDLIAMEAVNKPAAITVPSQAEKMVRAYSEELLEMGRNRNEVVVLDADLVVDCGLLPFKKEFPERFIECGIAEQDMVSMAGGLALKGKLPIVHSFACFLSTRPNEQIYNNSTEQKKIIYVGSLAGVLPASPGHSHQSVRDISTLGSIPGLTMVQPCNEAETKMALRWAVEKNPSSTYIRLVSIPRVLDYKLPPEYSLEKGCGIKLRGNKMNNESVAIVSYGPVMLQESFKAAEVLERVDISTAVFNFPWLNYADPKWLSDNLSHYRLMVIVDDHYTKLGLGTTITSTFAVNSTGRLSPRFILLGLTEIPACGQNDEVLRHHGLDADSIAERIKKTI